MMYVRFPLSLRNVEDLLHERGMDISLETVRFRWPYSDTNKQTRFRTAKAPASCPDSSGGKDRLGRILKMRSDYLRRMQVGGATSVPRRTPTNGNRTGA